MLARVLELLNGPDADAYDLSSLVTIWYGSTPMAPAMAERLLRVFGPVFVHVYGMTEFTGTATTLGKEEHELIARGDSDRIASCGRPVDGVELEIVGQDDRPVAGGDVGEIRMRSDFAMEAYWRDPERTSQTIRGGWLYTGDLGRQDASGYVYIVGRKKDLIIRNGEHIASKEIEDALHVHEAVLEAAAIGVPDPSVGEEIHAFVAVASDIDVSIDDIRAAASTRLPESRMPKSITILPSLPKNAVGKIQKVVLRERYGQGVLTDTGVGR
jgi:fatty-acyl-CoA synthase